MTIVSEQALGAPEQTDRNQERDTQTIDTLEGMVDHINQALGHKSEEITAYASFVKLGIINYLDIRGAVEQGFAPEGLEESQKAGCLSELARIGEETIIDEQRGHAYRFELESSIDRAGQTLNIVSYNLINDADIHDVLSRKKDFRYSTEQVQRRRVDGYRSTRSALSDAEIARRVLDMFDILNNPDMYDIPLDDLPVDISKYRGRSYRSLTDQELQEIIDEHRSNNDLIHNETDVASVEIDIDQMFDSLVSAGSESHTYSYEGGVIERARITRLLRLARQALRR